MHGRFHTFARQVDGRWQIAADYDSDENATVTAQDFAAAEAMDDDT